jgi:hypothetical protein
MPAMWERVVECEVSRCVSVGSMQDADCVGSRHAPPWM